MKKFLVFITLLLMPLSALTARADVILEEGVAARINCAFVLIADGAPKTTGTTNLRAERQSDSFYWNWNTSAFDSATFNASNHDGSMTYGGQAGATYKGSGWHRSWTPPAVGSETRYTLECNATDAYSYPLTALVRPEDWVKSTESLGSSGKTTDDTYDKVKKIRR